MDGEIVKYVTNIYTLIAFFIASIVYIVPFVVNHRSRKKQHSELIKQFDEQNTKLLTKIEEINRFKNVLDLQSSMDVIDIALKKSKFIVMIQIKDIIINDDISDTYRKSIIYSKIRNVINTQYDDDILILSRIYFNTNKLSKYIKDFNKGEVINDIFRKMETLNTNRKNLDIIIKDIIEYIENEYTQSIKSAQLQMN